LCEVVSVVSSVEKETLVVSFVQTQLRALIQDCVGDTTDGMTREQFADLLGRPQAARALDEVGVDVMGLLSISDFLFKDDKKLSFTDFMEMVLELRGTNTATVKHVVDLQRFVHLELRKTATNMEKKMHIIMGNPGNAERIPEPEGTGSIACSQKGETTYDQKGVQPKSHRKSHARR